MTEKKRYPPLYSEEDIQDTFHEAKESMDYYLAKRKKKQEILLEILREKGENDFLFWLAGVLGGYRRPEFVPNPDFYPDLKIKLDTLNKTGHLTDGLRVSRVGDFWETPMIRIEFPLDADLRDYRKAILLYQEYFQSLENDKQFVEYLVQEYGTGRTYKELAKEINEALSAWVNGETTKLDIFGFDEFIRKKGYTPEKDKNNPELVDKFDKEGVRNIVRYYHEKKEKNKGVKRKN